MSYSRGVFPRVVLAGFVALVALLVYALWPVVFPSPEAAVQRYFEALEARNLGGATEEMADHTSFALENSWSAMWTALSDERYQPPTEVRVGGWQHTPTGNGERMVAAQYELAGTTHSSLLKLRRMGGKWRITNAMGTVEVNVASARVNGTKVTDGRKLLLFPGIYEVAGNSSSSSIMTATPVTVVVTPDRVGAARLATALAPDALPKVKQRMDAVIKACDTTAVAWRTDCPFKGSAAVGLHQVKWTVVNLPELKIEQIGPDTLTVKGVGPGSVRLNAVDGAGVGIDRVDSFSIDGKCVEVDGVLSCTFSA